MSKTKEDVSKKKILIVEDNEQNRELLVDILNMKGYHTLEAENGEEAVEIALKECPNLILLDIQLPGIDGIEVLRRIKGNQKTEFIPVMAVTAHAMKGYGEDLIKTGFSDYCPKPFGLLEFLEKIKNLLTNDK